jgi:hypothetical protein
MTAWPLQKDCKSFYGNPDANGDGVPDRAWEDRNLVGVKAPWTMRLEWDPDTVLKSIRVHKLCAPSLFRVLNVIWEKSGKSQDQIERMGMDMFSGAYTFRVKRGGHTLSMHSFGCAVDFNAKHNRMGKPWAPLAGGMPLMVVEAFEAEGWVFGGRWSGGSCDPMHFQAARVS